MGLQGKKYMNLESSVLDILTLYLEIPLTVILFFLQ